MDSILILKDGYLRAISTTNEPYNLVWRHLQLTIRRGSKGVGVLQYFNPSRSKQIARRVPGISIWIDTAPKIQPEKSYATSLQGYLINGNANRNRAFLGLYDDQIMIIRNVLHRCVHKLRSGNNVKSHEGRHDIQLTIRQTGNMLVQTHKHTNHVGATYFSPMQDRVPFPKEINFF